MPKHDTDNRNLFVLTSVEVEFCDKLFVFIFEVLSYLLLSR